MRIHRNRIEKVVWAWPWPKKVKPVVQSKKTDNKKSEKELRFYLINELR